MSKQLTRELISQKAKTDIIEKITKINLWGNNIDDISIIEEMKQLQIISLSVNKISSLKAFKNHQNITELSLRSNNIFDFNEVRYLSSCPNLRVLWLNDNPISEDEEYRSKVIQLLPQITKLDDILIAESERFENIKNEYKDSNVFLYKNINEIENDGNVFENDNLINAAWDGDKERKKENLCNIDNLKKENNGDDKGRRFMGGQEKYKYKYENKFEMFNGQNFNGKLNRNGGKEKKNNEIEHETILKSILLLIGELNEFELNIVNDEIKNILQNEKM